MTFRDLPLGELFYFANDPDCTTCRKLPGGPFMPDYETRPGRQAFHLTGDDEHDLAVIVDQREYDYTPPHLRGRDMEETG